MSGGAEPLTSKRRWQAITAATLLLVPGFWSLLAGLVAAASDADGAGAPNPYAALALGLAVVPFVFLVLAVVSGHGRLAGAVLGAMGLALLGGGTLSALAGDAVTGIVAGVGAGATLTLRGGDDVSRRARFLAVAVATVYAFVLVRTAGAIALLTIPVLPVTSVGFADELVLWWRARDPGRLQPEA